MKTKNLYAAPLMALMLFALVFTGSAAAFAETAQSDELAGGTNDVSLLGETGNSGESGETGGTGDGDSNADTNGDTGTNSNPNPDSNANTNTNGESNTNSSITVTTAQELYDAIANATAGTVITLGANIDYDQSNLGSIPVATEVTLDCAEYKITVDEALFEIAATGSLTLRNAQIESTDDDIIDTNNGTLVIESTSGDGIVSSDDTITDNYGSITIKNGDFKPGYSLVYGNYGTASVTIENANVEAEHYIVGYLQHGGCSVTIKNGTYKSEYAIYTMYNGTVLIENGSFTTTDDSMDEITGGTVTVKGGTFTAGTEDDKAYCFPLTSFGILNIEGGEFTSTDNTISAEDSSEVTLTGGTFKNSSGEAAIYVNNFEGITIPDGYRADPADWEKTDASEVKIVPNIITITYMSQDAEYHTSTAQPSEQVFPDSPTRSDGYEFLFWETESGDRIDDPTTLTQDTTLYAVFSDRTYTVSFLDKGTTTTETVVIGTPLGKVPHLDRADDGDGFLAWKMGNETVGADTTDGVYSDISLTAVYGDMITTYEQLKDAIKNKQEVITLGADIPVEDTITIDYDCEIDGNSFGLIRPENFKGALLSTIQGVTGGEDGGDITQTATTLTARNLLIDGKGYDAYAPAVYVSTGTTLNMEGVTVQNNKTNLTDREYIQKDFCSHGDGGGFYIEHDSSVNLKNCKVLSNSTSDWGDGGGIYAKGKDRTSGLVHLTIDGCTIQGNSTGTYGDGGGICVTNAADIDISNSLIDKNTARYGGGLSLSFCTLYDDADGASLTDTVISNNEADFGGGLDLGLTIVHLYGTTSLEHNKAQRGGASNSGNGGDDGNTIIYMHDTSSMSYNEATEDGGAVYEWEQLLVMYDDSCLHHNTAGENGGAVYASEYGIQQKGGTIRDNTAGGNGGGVYNAYGSSAFETGMIYDNTADGKGDDLYSHNIWSTLYATQPSRVYGDGDSEKLGTVSVQKIDGYHEPDLKGTSIPFYGWFVDSEEGGEWKSVLEWRRNPATESWDRVWVTKYVPNGVFSNEYKSVEESTRVCEENENTDYLGSEDWSGEFGLKAIWYGLLLAYDANIPDSDDYKYDTTVYLPSSEAEAQDSMFKRDGYRFTGWNTKADGTGTAYAAGDTVVMDKSQVLYCQWERVYSVKYEVTPDATYGSPADAAIPVDTNEYQSGDTVTVEPNLTTSWTTSDGTESGIPGTWTFTPWDKESGFEIADDTVITGAWTFTVDPDYDPDGGDDSGDDPDDPDGGDDGDRDDSGDSDGDESDNGSSNGSDKGNGAKDGDSPTSTDAVPLTGDESMLSLALGIALASGAAVAGAAAYRRRQIS